MCVHTCVHALRFIYICECAHGGLSSTMDGTQSFSTLHFEDFFFTEPRSHQLTRLMGNCGDPTFSAMIPVLVLGVHRQTFLWHVSEGSNSSPLAFLVAFDLQPFAIPNTRILMLFSFSVLLYCFRRSSYVHDENDFQNWSKQSAKCLVST